MKSKLVSFLGFAVIALGVVSCSSDDNSSDIGNNKLVGKWNETEQLALDAKGKVLETLVEDNGVCPLNNAEYVAGGIIKNNYYNYSEVASNCEANSQEGTWKVEGNKLKLGMVKEGVNVEVVFKISEMSDKVLLLDKPMSRDDADNYPENTVTIRNVFKKVK